MPSSGSEGDSDYLGGIAHYKEGGMNDLADGKLEMDTLDRIIEDILYFESEIA